MSTVHAEFYGFDPQARANRLCKLALEGLARWDLEHAELSLVKYRENVVFRATRPGEAPLAVRVHRHGYHTDAALRSELQWIRALGEQGVDVPEVVPASDGELFAVVHSSGVPEPRQVDVFEWIDGETLAEIGDNLDSDPVGLANVYAQLGEIAAQVHTQALTWKRPHGFVRPAWDAEGLAGANPVWGRFWELAALSGEERTLIERVRDVVHADLLAYGKPEGRYGLIHADLVLDNLLVDGDRIRLIDFDDAGDGWHLFDLATVLRVYLGSDRFDLVRDAMLEGYQRQRLLSDADLQALPVLLMARGLTYLAWMHTRRDTESARIKTPSMIAMACGLAERYLSGDGVG